ncbi:uronyl 2-sulfotransferase-like isoform X2 [Styela clava]
MKPFGRQRKLWKFFASFALLVVIYVMRDRNLNTVYNNTVRCANGYNAEGSCKDSDRMQVNREAIGRNLESVPNDETHHFHTDTIATEAIWPGIVVYNRVPKCASSTLRQLITRLQRRNKFRYEIHNWPNVKQSLTSNEESELVGQVTSLPQPLLFLRHLHFVDFEKYNVTKPAYINMIRHPINRFVSHYYFSRFGFVNWTEEKIRKWLWPMSKERREMSLDECVKNGAEKCVVENHENFMQFFCGQDVRCKYFTGATNIFQASPNSGSHTKTANKVKPTNETVSVLSVALSREIELYNFVKQRLDFQITFLKKSGKIT